MHDLAKLKTLVMSGNKLTYLFNNALEDLSELEHIDLSKNAIDEIQDDVFSHLRKLRTINLSENQLSTDNFLENVDTLKNLNMSHNQFENLNLSMFYHYHNVELNGNPWNCSWLIAEMMTVSHGIEFGHNYTIEMQDQLLMVPGIDCKDEEGKHRSIVVLEIPKEPHQRSDKIVVSVVLIYFLYSK